MTDERLVNGSITCLEGHIWKVVNEILRFDEEDNNEEMKFLDHPLTGFPKDVSEEERLEFLRTYENEITNLTFNQNRITLLQGDPILFFRYLRSQDSVFVISNPDEGILRQLQEVAVQKMMYSNMAFVKSITVELDTDVDRINLFNEKTNGYLNYHLTKDSIGRVLWQGRDVDFRVEGSRFQYK